MLDEVTQEYVSERRATTADGEQLLSFGRRTTLLLSREVELLARLSSFEDCGPVGDYTDEPLAGGHSTHVWTRER